VRHRSWTTAIAGLLLLGAVLLAPALAPAERIAGTAGGDRLLGSTAADRLLGLSGRDRLLGGGGRDALRGGPGNDRLFGGAGNDVLVGGPGADRLTGDEGADTLQGGRGADHIFGGPGADVVNGGIGSDRINLGSGDDRVSARDRRTDTIRCGPGRDRVTVDRFDVVTRDCELVFRSTGNLGGLEPFVPGPPISPGPGLGVRTIATGFDDPLLVAGRPGDNRLFVVEQGGRIRTVSAAGLDPTPWLDISGLVSAGGERGLLGLAFHPQHATNGRFYVDYTDKQGTTQVVEYRSTPGGAVIAGSARTVLTVAQPYANHNGGHLAFAPDGRLYVALGDGGGSGDPQDNGQSLAGLLGSILRIDVNGRSPGLGYAIPPDNPFVGRADARGEIWSFGLRNPWRFSFDRANGDLWIGDVGQGSREEVDHVTLAGSRGANFGWNRFEGYSPYDSRPLSEGTHTPPVVEYGHGGGGCSVTGGYVYRGPTVLDLRGRYVYGDYCSGRIVTLLADGAPGGPVDITAALGGAKRMLRSFGEDTRGELYLASGDAVLRVTPAPG
jgi:hypothetical protein